MKISYAIFLSTISYWLSANIIIYVDASCL